MDAAIVLDWESMRYTTYSRYVSGLLETLNLQALLDQLADFLLQSGFAGGPYSHPFWCEFGEDDPDRSLDALRQAILQALMDSGQLTPDMLNVLRGDSTGDARKDAELQKQLADLLDQIVQKLIDEGYLNLQQAPKMPGAQQPVLGPGGVAKEAAQQVQFNLTDKGIDFLGYRTLKHLLGSIGKSSFGAHETEHLATGVEAEAASKRYEYGDTLTPDVHATPPLARLDRQVELRRARARPPRARRRSRGREQTLRVRRHPEPRRQRDAPARPEARRPRRPDQFGVRRPDGASGRVSLVIGDGVDARLFALDDSVRRGSLHAGEESGARADAFDSDAIPGRYAARRAVPRHGGRDSDRPARARAGGTVSHEHDGGAEARAPDPDGAAQGHASDHHDHRRQTVGADAARRQDLRELDGPGPAHFAGHLSRGRAVPALGDPDQHLHARARPQPGRVREEGVRDLPRQGLLHEHDDARPVHSHGFHEKEDAPGVVGNIPQRSVASVSLHPHSLTHEA